jgi:hypothetical protein
MPCRRLLGRFALRLPGRRTRAGRKRRWEAQLTPSLVWLHREVSVSAKQCLLLSHSRGVRWLKTLRGSPAFVGPSARGIGASRRIIGQPPRRMPRPAPAHCPTVGEPARFVLGHGPPFTSERSACPHRWTVTVKRRHDGAGVKESPSTALPAFAVTHLPRALAALPGRPQPRGPLCQDSAGSSVFRWTVSQNNRPLPANQWTTTQPNSPPCCGLLSNDRCNRPFRSGPRSTVHERAIRVSTPGDGDRQATPRGMPRPVREVCLRAGCPSAHPRRLVPCPVRPVRHYSEV